MWRYYLLLLCLTHGDTEQPEAGDDSTESWNCTDINVEVLEGKTLNLISHLDATGGSCLWIHNEECCYEKKNGDCEYYRKSVKLNVSRCPKDDGYEVKIDSYKDLTCTLVIKSFNEAASGSYQSISQHNNPLRKCFARVAAPVEERGGLSVGEVAALVIGLLVTFALLVALLVVLYQRATNTLRVEETDVVVDRQNCGNTNRLHKLLVNGENDDILKRKKELNHTVLNQTCTIGTIGETEQQVNLSTLCF